MLNDQERNHIILSAYKDAGVNVPGLVKAHGAGLVKRKADVAANLVKGAAPNIQAKAFNAVNRAHNMASDIHQSVGLPAPQFGHAGWKGGA